MPELSPAAQGVLDAVHEVMADTSLADLLAIAAALRAAADQVVPERLESFGVRKQFLAIAEELENH